MQKINDTLRKLANKKDFQQRYEVIKKKIMTNEEIQSFLRKNQREISQEMIDRSLGKLYEYTAQSKECNRCPSLDGCVNMMKGFHPHIVIHGNNIDLQYERCPRKVLHDERRKHERLIQSIYVPKEILNASLGEIELNKGRIKAIELAATFVDNFNKNEKEKGLYFYGKFGVGKSYILGAIANELAKKGVSSLIVYVPEFLREMKSAIGDQTIDVKLETIKKAPILMLDDIGAETMSSWARDEVLGTILQFRMLESLPTFFTSNFDLEELEHHLTYSQRGEEERLKAARIMERIKYLAKPVHVDGPNRRL
ncbi:primosomal protein DnaI [Bacillus aquiflavi]|uniref:primosomal protein DnaI n=1 Tax=Bacillus aquiflavi TaxID=2672567 RepID=UPI001CA7FFC2|nr:primosomal protein DnaI [Bacillus aquiflavi]UAC50084.1 primosomal protein DnaI [Bacillus aquiflavi]